MRWDEEIEVLVIGYGGAGAVAAITAHDAGSRVLVVEKSEGDQHKWKCHWPSKHDQWCEADDEFDERIALPQSR